MGFTIKGYLSKLLDVSYETREVDGVPQECIVIPLEKNGLKRHPKSGNVMVELAMYEQRPNAWRTTHYVSWVLPRELYLKYKEYGLSDRFTFFGNAKLNFNKSTGKFAGTQKSIDDILEGK